MADIANYAEALEQHLHRWSWAERHKHDLASSRKESIVAQSLPIILAGAETLWWSRDTLAVTRSAARTMPDNWVLLEERMPLRSGFAWFEQPLESGDMNGEFYGIAWGMAEHSEKPDETILLAFPMIRRQEAGEPVEVMGFCTWPVGSPIGVAADTGSEDADRATIATRRFLAAAFQFMSQRILTETCHEVGRATRKRAERAGYQHQPVVRVVQLRVRESHHEGDEAHESVDWSCRWMVRGHWRQQFYPSLGIHQPKWILPFVKGPDGKPFKEPRATVYAVVR